jgi:hypothetical protein
MLTGQMQSPLWLISRLVLIPKPANNPLAPLAPGANPPSTTVTLRPLGLPEIIYRLAGRATVRIEGPLVGPTMAPVQLGVGIPFSCQIGAKGAQCAFDAHKAVSTWDGNSASAFNTEPRQDTFSGVSDRAPRLLRYYIWGYGCPTPLLWRGQRVRWSATGVKQGDPAGCRWALQAVLRHRSQWGLQRRYRGAIPVASISFRLRLRQDSMNLRWTTSETGSAS